MVKGVQNPVRGLFTRYYLLKMIKDKLPDEGNEFETEDCNFKDTMDFILQNLDEMNRLWIRLNTTNVNVPAVGHCQCCGKHRLCEVEAV